MCVQVEGRFFYEVFEARSEDKSLILVAFCRLPSKEQEVFQIMLVAIKSEVNSEPKKIHNRNENFQTLLQLIYILPYIPMEDISHAWETIILSEFEI